MKRLVLISTLASLIAIPAASAAAVDAKTGKIASKAAQSSLNFTKGSKKAGGDRSLNFTKPADTKGLNFAHPPDQMSLNFTMPTDQKGLNFTRHTDPPNPDKGQKGGKTMPAEQKVLNFTRSNDLLGQDFLVPAVQNGQGPAGMGSAPRLGGAAARPR